MHKHTITPSHLALLALALGLWLSPTQVQANAQVARSTKHYLQGYQQYKAQRYKEALRSYRKAYRYLPKHPHFHCHRAQFLNYMARAQEKRNQHLAAMRSYYHAAYKSGCQKAKITGYAARHYRSLHTRWTCSVRFRSASGKVRVIQITAKGDRKLGVTPYHARLSPGRYKFKLRLYDHRTIYWNVQLSPGQHIKRSFTMVRGDDPITRHENPAIAPPVPFAKTTPARPKANPKVAKGKVVLPTPIQKPKVGKEGKEGGDLVKPMPGRIKSGPVYKQAWFWAVIGGVAVAAVVIPIAIPKEQSVTLGQGPIFQK